MAISNSINTNPGALIALQNLNATNRNIGEVQGRINTGLKIASAKDNGAIYAIAQNQRAEVASLNAVSQSIDRAVSAVDVALSAGAAVSDLLVELKEKALSASDASLDAASRTALSDDFEALRVQINQIVNAAEFNGLNLLNGTTGAVVALTSADGQSSISVSAQTLTTTGAAIGLTGASSLGLQTQTAASATLTKLASSISAVNSALAKLGTGAKSLEIQQTFTQKLSDALKVGIGNLVDADLATESARLQALQVQQQLGLQALSIANQAPQSVLALFR